jgi:vacuolar-type H+-ATPase subunit H
VKEKEKILNEAHSKASTLLIEEEHKIQQQQDKRISDHKDKIKATKAKKLEEGRKLASEAEYKASKNIGKATAYIIKKIDEKVG